MMARHETSTAAWMELSEAADYLGVHFTTLRRWADDGKVPYIRTPGGRRRFNRAELSAFLVSMRSGSAQHESMIAQGFEATGHAGARLTHVGVSQEPWYSRLDEMQRNAMRSEGQRLMAVLMQYATRSNGGEVFLAEGRRLAAHYGEACHSANLSLVETVQAFVRVRRSIMDSVYQAGALAGSPDADTWRLYDRMNNFLDNMLLATLEAYEGAGKKLLGTQDAGSSP